ncbi:MAG TPA: hypothetical protein VJ748_01680, partial [Vitreimonas sp.]|nr:hypothetical protein [Vitreimonas sp.]
MAQRETPTELFKRSLAQTTRALAGREEELEVTFGAEGPRLSPGKIVLPHPPRVISEPEAERLRGQADALALRLAHHDDREHARMRPQGAEARVVFDAVEDMRVQALGANAMKGVAGNLTAALTDSLERKGAARMHDRAVAPLADALALMVRERLTGLAPPDNAKALVNSWRKDIERDAGGTLDRLAATADSQHDFALVMRDVLSELGMGDEFGAEADQDDRSEGEQNPPPQSENTEGQDEQDQDAMSEMEMVQSDVDMETDRTVSIETDSDSEDTDESEQEEPGEKPIRPKGRNEPEDPSANYKVFTKAHDEEIGAEEL